MAALQETAATDGYASYGGRDRLWFFIANISLMIIPGYDAYSPETKSTDSVGYAWVKVGRWWNWPRLMELEWTPPKETLLLNICDLEALSIVVTKLSIILFIQRTKRTWHRDLVIISFITLNINVENYKLMFMFYILQWRLLLKSEKDTKNAKSKIT